MSDDVDPDKFTAGGSMLLVTGAAISPHEPLIGMMVVLMASVLILLGFRYDQATGD